MRALRNAAYLMAGMHLAFVVAVGVEAAPYAYNVPVAKKDGTIYYFRHNSYDPRILFCTQPHDQRYKIELDCVADDRGALVKVRVVLKATEARG